jgi:hypothetical protein
MLGDAFLDWRAPALRTGRSNGEVVRWRSTVEERGLRLPVLRRQSQSYSSRPQRRNILYWGLPRAAGHVRCAHGISNIRLARQVPRCSQHWPRRCTLKCH